jgi:hypothetical protein
MPYEKKYLNKDTDGGYYDERLNSFRCRVFATPYNSRVEAEVVLECYGPSDRKIAPGIYTIEKMYIVL